MSCTGGSKNSSTMGKRYARDPVKSPRKNARKNPMLIRQKENAMADQKSGRRICSQSARSVSDRSHKENMIPDQGGSGLPENDPEKDDREPAEKSGKTMIHGGCLLP